ELADHLAELLRADFDRSRRNRLLVRHANSDAAQGRIHDHAGARDIALREGRRKKEPSEPMPALVPGRRTIVLLSHCGTHHVLCGIVATACIGGSYSFVKLSISKRAAALEDAVSHEQTPVPAHAPRQTTYGLARFIRSPRRRARGAWVEP